MATKKPKKRLKHPTPRADAKAERLKVIAGERGLSALANQVAILQDILPAQERVCAKRAAEVAVWADNTVATKRELELESIRILDLLSRTDATVKDSENHLDVLRKYLDSLAGKVAELEKRFQYVAYPSVTHHTIDPITGQVSW